MCLSTSLAGADGVGPPEAEVRQVGARSTTIQPDTRTVPNRVTRSQTAFYATAFRHTRGEPSSFPQTGPRAPPVDIRQGRGAGEAEHYIFRSGRGCSAFARGSCT